MSCHMVKSPDGCSCSSWMSLVCKAIRHVALIQERFLHQLPAVVLLEVLDVEVQIRQVFLAKEKVEGQKVCLVLD